MLTARVLTRSESATAPRHQEGALALARRLPSLVASAKELAASVMHGVHGRRRAGTGENFWQFRPFTFGESVQRIDWRRSARDDRLYVREREWEAAHTIFLWMDLSPSMAFLSSMARQSKADRALVLGLATADLLVRGGERVGLLGMTRAIAARNIVERLAEALVVEDLRMSSAGHPDFPSDEPLPQRTQVILISDFLVAPDALATRLRCIASNGARGHLVMIADPVEETFPFEGHTEFLDVDSGALFRAGRAEAYRPDYVARLARHRERVRNAAREVGFSFALHRTDAPPATALLALRGRLEANVDIGAVA
ncbi:MAG: DUF58 domain-containing protein [Methylobacteriaceae bacterium]|nr:DUF58 domain-containing protein [Methylobacteriaceae bacterium]